MGSAYPTAPPASGAYPLPIGWSDVVDQLADDANDTNDAVNYAWQGVDTAPTVARFASTGAETYSITAGSVTQINGPTLDGGTPGVGDPVLLKDCPPASGAGSVGSSQPANGLYYVTAVGANLTVARAATMSVKSAQPNPAGRVVFVGAGGVANARNIFQVTQPSGDAAFTYGTTAMQWTKFVPDSGLTVPPVVRPQRNTIAVVGDSITALGSEGWYGPWLGYTWINQLQVLSHQRIRYCGGNFAVAGTTIVNQQTVQLPQVLAMNPLPGACVLAVGTNDIQGVTFDLNATVTALKAMVASLLAVGVAPILWCPPPNSFVWAPGTGATVAQIHARTYQWNTWIRRYAASNGFALVDAFTALAQVDGTAIPGTMLTGAIHPNGDGQRLIAQQAIADGLADIFPPNSLVNTARTTDDLTTMLNDGTINQGLFTTDSNSDGVADGLGPSGSGTYSFSLVAPVPSDQLQGNWQQSTVAAGGTSLIGATFSTGWSPGDTIAFSARIQTSGVEASGGQYLIALLTDTPGGFVTPDGSATLTFLWNGIFNWTSDIDDGELYVEFPIPADATDLQLRISIGGTLASSVTLRIGELTVRNLTTGGLLV